MRPSIINGNIIEQHLGSVPNIIYKPYSRIFDLILFDIGYNFFIFDSQYYSNTSNALGLPESHIGLYNYSLYITNDLLDLAKDSISKQLHLNSICFEHNKKYSQLKKEDLLIIEQKSKTVPKIFFDKNHLESWNQKSSVLIEYGIPTDILRSEIHRSDRQKDVLICNLPNNNIGFQLQSFLQQQNLVADIFELNNLKTLQDFSRYFNQYKVFIDLTNQKLLSLTSFVCGCYTVVLGDTNYGISSIRNVSSIDSIIQSLNINSYEESEYLHDMQTINDRYNYSLFKVKISDIINDESKGKAFLL
jgi:hypothetical protein